MNRAMDGDEVVLELLPRAEWVSEAQAQGLGVLGQDKGSGKTQEDEAAAEAENDSGILVYVPVIQRCKNGFIVFQCFFVIPG